MKKFLKILLGDMDDLKLVAKTPATIAKKHKQVEPLTKRKLIELESSIGGQLFGPVPANQRREFFCLDDTTWMWYEQWRDESGNLRQTTVRYEVQPQGILKAQEGARYSYLQGAELDNFMKAIQAYDHQVRTKIYGPILNTA